MNDKRDYCEILGLPRKVSAEQIKKSYRCLAMKYHPDRNPGDKEAEDCFKEAESFQGWETRDEETKSSLWMSESQRT